MLNRSLQTPKYSNSRQHFGRHHYNIKQKQTSRITLRWRTRRRRIMTDSGRLLLLPTPVVVVQLRQTRKGLPTSIKRKKDASNEDESNWKTIEVKGVSLQEDGMHDKTRVHVNTFVRLDRISDNCTVLGEGTCTWGREALPRRQNKSLWRKTGLPRGNGRMGGVG